LSWQIKFTYMFLSHFHIFTYYTQPVSIIRCKAVKPCKHQIFSTLVSILKKITLWKKLFFELYRLIGTVPFLASQKEAQNSWHILSVECYHLLKPNEIHIFIALIFLVQSETENTKDSHVANSYDAAIEYLKVNEMRFADFRNKLIEILHSVEIK